MPKNYYEIILPLIIGLCMCVSILIVGINVPKSDVKKYQNQSIEYCDTITDSSHKFGNRQHIRHYDDESHKTILPNPYWPGTSQSFKWW